jgi:hypothetical protein
MCVMRPLHCGAVAIVLLLLLQAIRLPDVASAVMYGRRNKERICY